MNNQLAIVIAGTLIALSIFFKPNYEIIPESQRYRGRSLIDKRTGSIFHPKTGKWEKGISF